MAFKLGSSFEAWLDRKVEVLKAEGILRSKFNDLKRTFSVVSEDEHLDYKNRQTDKGNKRTRAKNNTSRQGGGGDIKMNTNFAEFKDNPAETPEQYYSDDPETAEVFYSDFPENAEVGGVNSDISPNSDYYKFVWQDDDDFEAQLGPPGGGYRDYSDAILREIDSELAGDLGNGNLGQKPGQLQKPGHRPRSRPKRSADRGHVVLISDRKEVGGGARFVSGGQNEESDEDEDEFQDVSDGMSDPWFSRDQSTNTNKQGQPHRGRGDGQSTENVGGLDRNSNHSNHPGVHGNHPGIHSNQLSTGPRELQHVVRDASDVQKYYHTQIAPVSKDRILLPMEEVEMSYSEDETGEDEMGEDEMGERTEISERTEMPTDEETIYSHNRQAAETDDFGIDSDDTRPIIVVEQSLLTQKAQVRTRRLKRAMMIVGVVTALVAFGLAAYFIVHLLASS